MAVQRSGPGEVGVDEAALLALLATPAAQQWQQLVVQRHGRRIVEWQREPYRASDLRLVYSLSKTFTSAAVGLAVEAGCFGYDDTIAELLPDLAGGAGERTRRIRVRDCLAMGTGHAVDLLDLATRASLDEQSVATMLATRPEHEPGEHFCYNQLATFTLSVLVQRTTGDDLLAWLRPRLLDPLGAPPLHWQRTRDGFALGYSGLHVDIGTLACFLQLLLDQGFHQGRRLLPLAWVEQYSRHHVDTPGPDADWSRGYGWQVWRQAHGHRGDGAFGQYGVVLPEQDMVVAITSETTAMQPTLDALWQHLLPGVDPQGLTPGAETIASSTQGLARWLDEHPVASPALPFPGPVGEAPVALRARYALVDDHADLRWSERDGHAVRCEVGLGGWRRSRLEWPEGWLDLAATGMLVDGQLHATVLLLNTPHAVQLVAPPDGGEGTGGWARWRLRPLGLPRTVRDLALPHHLEEH